MIDTTHIHNFRDLSRAIIFHDNDFTLSEVQSLIAKCIELKDAQYTEIFNAYDLSQREITDNLFRQWEACIKASANK